MVTVSALSHLETHDVHLPLIGDVNFDRSANMLSNLCTILLPISNLWGDSLWLCKYPALHINFLLHWSSIANSCLIQFLLWWIQNDDSFKFTLPFTFSFWLSLLSLFAYLSINLIYQSSIIYLPDLSSVFSSIIFLLLVWTDRFFFLPIV